jgi:putative glycosyltransferase (TIGR04372 family)
MLFLPDDWVRNIGHLALLDFWVKMQHLGWSPWRKLVLVAPPRVTANAAYLEWWRRYFTVITDPYLVRAVAPFAAALGSRVAGLLRLPDGLERYFGEGMGVVQEEWEARGKGPLLELTAADRERGQELLAHLGVPRGAWFVCLHVRSPSFHNEGEAPDQAHRNADVRSYLPAVRHILARGGWVVRLGDPDMEPAPPLPGFADYARSPVKSPWMDVFLCAACRFFIGVASGLSHVPGTFGVPCVLTNWVSSPLPVAGGRDLFIPKLIRAEAENRYLGFAEFLEPGIGRLSHCGGQFRERSLRPTANSPEDILELVREMLEILDGTIVRTPAEKRLQQSFREAATRCGLVGFSRLGRAFLSKHAHLLPQQGEEASRAAPSGYPVGSVRGIRPEDGTLVRGPASD